MIALFLATGSQCLALEEGSLKDTLTRLSQEILSLEEPTIKEHQAPDDIAESGGESTIFFVYDKGQPIAVIKKYLLDNSHFESEYLIMTELNTTAFREFHPVHLIATAEEEVDGAKVGFIIETIAPGKSLNHYLQELSKTKFIKRAKLFSELKRGVEKTALGLAELHGQKIFDQPSRYYENRYDNIAEEAGEGVVESLPGPFGYIHGDAHFGNIFYDTKTDSAHFIDFSSTYASKNGGPIGQDVANIILALDAFGSYYQLAGAEIQTLKNTFLTTYRSHGPEISDETIAFYRHYFLLIYTSQFTEDENIEQAKYFYNYCKEELDLRA